MQYDRKPDSIEEQKKQAALRVLSNLITKRFKTTMIGALDSIEYRFGYLWGINSKEDKTENQDRFHQLWQEARTEILDRGNNELRVLLAALADYDIEKRRHSIDFYIKDRK